MNKNWRIRDVTVGEQIISEKDREQLGIAQKPFLVRQAS
jgi:hypothetical protein